MPRIPYTRYPDLGPQQVPGPRIDIPPASNIAAFGGNIGAAEERLGAGIADVGTAAANIQNLKDEVTTNQAVTQNFKTIDVMNGQFQQLPGDQQQAGLDAHIDAMRNQVQSDSANMTVNQKLMFDRQTLWNLRAQISRAVSSADQSYHAFARDSIVGGINNDVDHAIRNIDNDALFHLDMQAISEKYSRLATMDRVPVQMMQYNLRKTFDAVAGKMVRAIALGPREDVGRAQSVLDTLSGQMSAPVTQQLQAIIDDKKNDIEAKHWSRDTSNRVAPFIGGSNTTGVVVQPGTAPTEPVVPIPSVEPSPGPKPEIRSEIDPAQDALNRGDYLAFATETYRPHAPPVQLASLPRAMPERGSVEVNGAIDNASRQYGLDPNTMRAIASIESDNNPGSNRRRATQYKGLFQIGKDEWRRYGEGDIYNATDNAMAAARMLADHKTWFQQQYGRAPTDTELYMMHQQGRGFFTRGAMTNIRGNPYPGMRGPQSHGSFQAGWGQELARRKMLLAGPEFAGA